MALSNIFREPQREITESVVGISATAAFIFADYGFAGWIGCKSGPDYIVGMMVGIVAAIVLSGFLVLTHAIGDGICELLQDNGIHFRPRVRK